MNKSKQWYRQAVDSNEFKTGLKETKLFRLYTILASFVKEQKEGQKVGIRIAIVKKEIDRRKKSWLM